MNRIDWAVVADIPTAWQIRRPPVLRLEQQRLRWARWERPAVTPLRWRFAVGRSEWAFLLAEAAAARVASGLLATLVLGATADAATDAAVTAAAEAAAAVAASSTALATSRSILLLVLFAGLVV